MTTILVLYAVFIIASFCYLARTRPREGTAHDDARRAAKAAAWSLLWPLTAAAYALGYLYRLINEIGR